MINLFPLKSATDVFQTREQLVEHLKSWVPGRQLRSLEDCRVWTAFKIVTMGLTQAKEVTLPPAYEVASMISERMRERGFDSISQDTRDHFAEIVEGFLVDIGASIYFQNGLLTDAELLDLAESVAKELWEAVK